jgi:hypothetical protein
MNKSTSADGPLKGRRLSRTNTFCSREDAGWREFKDLIRVESAHISGPLRLRFVCFREDLKQQWHNHGWPAEGTPISRG